MDKNLHRGLESVIKGSALPSITQNLGEVIYDGFLEDGILKDIPLVGTLFGLVNFGNSLNKYYFAKKIHAFLVELEDIPQEKRNKVIQEINESKEFRSSVGEVIFETLDKIESDGKPEIIGKLFSAVIENKIDYKTYLKLSHTVKNTFYYDLDTLNTSLNIGVLKDFYGNEELFGNGILNCHISCDRDLEAENTFTELGKTLFKYGF